MSDTVLLTGAAGFIGRAMARALAQTGANVVGVDMAPEENAPTENLARYVQLQLPHDGLDPILESESPDACVHCAGRASVPLSFDDPRNDFRSATLLTFELLESLRRRAPDCRFVFLSSAAVYGEPNALPVNEDERVKPISPYGFHKRQCELLCEEYASIYGLPTCILRIFSAYGPGLRRQVIWDLCYRVLTEKRLSIHGTGSESRDFIHVKDIVRAATLVLDKSEMAGEVYNVASGREVTLRELADKLAGLFELRNGPEFDGVVPEGNPLNWRADISKLEALGFAPKTDFDEGLSGFATWCRSEIGS